MTAVMRHFSMEIELTVFNGAPSWPERIERVAIWGRSTGSFGIAGFNYGRMNIFRSLRSIYYIEMTVPRMNLPRETRTDFAGAVLVWYHHTR